MIHIRRAGAMDAPQMAELLNAIIAKGGTTAFTNTVTRDTMLEWMGKSAEGSAWHVAEDDNGDILGYQDFLPKDALPEDACDIATFTRMGQTGLGIGSKLFEATKAAARDLGYTWINATIRADNTGGLAYYQSRGFEDYASVKDVPLENGQIVDRIKKRYDL